MVQGSPCARRRPHLHRYPSNGRDWGSKRRSRRLGKAIVQSVCSNHRQTRSWFPSCRWSLCPQGPQLHRNWAHRNWAHRNWAYRLSQETDRARFGSATDDPAHQKPCSSAWLFAVHLQPTRRRTPRGHGSLLVRPLGIAKPRSESSARTTLPVTSVRRPSDRVPRPKENCRRLLRRPRTSPRRADDSRGKPGGFDACCKLFPRGDYCFSLR